MNPIIHKARYCAAGLTLTAGLVLSHIVIASHGNTDAAPNNTDDNNAPVTIIASDPSAIVGSLPYLDLPTDTEFTGTVDGELTAAVDQAIQALSLYSDNPANKNVQESAQQLVEILGSDPIAVSAAVHEIHSAGESGDKDSAKSATPAKAESAAGKKVTANPKDHTEPVQMKESATHEKASNDSETPAALDPSAKASSQPDDSSKDAKQSRTATAELPEADAQAELASQIMTTVRTLESSQDEWALPTVSVDSSAIDVNTVLLAAANQFDAAALNHSNGKIAAEDMCAVASAPGQKLRCDAALSFDLLNQDFKEEFGTDIGITDSYRSYESQVRVKESKGFLAATPGHSNHGWGLALDLNGPIAKFGTEQRQWMIENGPKYGWIAPEWAMEDGSKPEPWHYEFEGTPAPDADASTWTFYDVADLSAIEAILNDYNMELPQRPAAVVPEAREEDF